MLAGVISKRSFFLKQLRSVVLSHIFSAGKWWNIWRKGSILSTLIHLRRAICPENSFWWP